MATHLDVASVTGARPDNVWNAPTPRLDSRGGTNFLAL